MSTYYTDIPPGGAVRAGNLTITVVKKSGRKTRLKIEGDDEVEYIKVAPPPEPAEVERGRQ